MKTIVLTLIRLVIVATGLTVALNFLALGFMFLPDIMERTATILSDNASWFTYIAPGLLPMLSVLFFVSGTVYITLKTMLIALKCNPMWI